MPCYNTVPISIIPPTSQGVGPLVWQNGSQINRLNIPLNPSLFFYDGSKSRWGDGSAQSPITLPNIQLVSGSPQYVIGSNNGTWGFYNPNSIIPTTASNLAGGTAGSIPYQSAVNTTGFTTSGTTNQVLVSGGTGSPTWANVSSLQSYPSAGIANSTGTGWGSSYNTIGTGTTLALSNSATLNTPTIGVNGSFYTPQATAPTFTVAGQTWYDSVVDSFVYYNSTGYEIYAGYQLDQVCYNNTGSSIPLGTVVYLSGGNNGQYAYISKATAATQAGSNALGVTGQSIAAGATGTVVVFGEVLNFNTTGFTSGQQLYLSPTTAGALTSTLPTNPFYAVSVATVILGGSTNGSIYVTVRPVYVLSSNIISPLNITAFSSTSTAANFYGVSGQLASIFNVWTSSGGINAFQINGSGALLVGNSAGTAGQVLTSGGSSSVATWGGVAAKAYGNVTSAGTLVASSFYPTSGLTISGPASGVFTITYSPLSTTSKIIITQTSGAGYGPLVTLGSGSCTVTTYAGSTPTAQSFSFVIF